MMEQERAAVNLYVLRELHTRGISWHQIPVEAYQSLIEMLYENQDLSYTEGALDVMTMLALGGHLK